MAIAAVTVAWTTAGVFFNVPDALEICDKTVMPPAFTDLFWLDQVRVDTMTYEKLFHAVISNNVESKAKERAGRFIP
jgi:hypothetical protein